MKLGDMLHEAGVWLSRATGIGYKAYPTLDKTIDWAKVRGHAVQARQIGAQLDALDRELQRERRADR